MLLNFVLLVILAAALARVVCVILDLDEGDYYD